MSDNKLPEKDEFVEKIKRLLDMVAKECGGEGDGRWTEAIIKKVLIYFTTVL